MSRNFHTHGDMRFAPSGASFNFSPTPSSGVCPAGTTTVQHSVTGRSGCAPLIPTGKDTCKVVHHAPKDSRFKGPELQKGLTFFPGAPVPEYKGPCKTNAMGTHATRAPPKPHDVTSKHSAPHSHTAPGRVPHASHPHGAGGGGGALSGGASTTGVPRGFGGGVMKGGKMM
jgi:hypothetical protein